MDVWAKLGIEPTDDLLSIRGAHDDSVWDDAESEEQRVARIS